MPDRPAKTTTLLLIALVWLSAALMLGASGKIEELKPPLPQVVLLSLTAITIIAGFAVPSFRRWVLTVDPRVFVSLHLARFVGAYFLVLHERGELPFDFAVPGGCGDIAVAAMALLLLATISPATKQGRRAYLIWNVLGLIDILFVVTTAARLGMADPASMKALLQLPLSLLPTFLVPLIIASHVALFVRLWDNR